MDFVLSILRSLSNNVVFSLARKLISVFFCVTLLYVSFSIIFCPLSDISDSVGMKKATKTLHDDKVK